MSTTDDTKDLVKNVDSLLSQGYTLKECAMALKVNRTMLWKWLCKDEDWKGVHHSYNLQEACSLIINSILLRAYGATWGIRFIHDPLRRMGFKISRALVNQALLTMMPSLLERLHQGRLIRRDYDVYMPMQVWHLDSHDKLARWGFRIHGAIDGGTHYIVYMVVSLNKKMGTIYDAYQDAVDKFGHPLMIRSDYAREHNLIQADILQARPSTNAFWTGPSTHNQRIEAFWGTLLEKVTNYYQVALTLLSEEEGYLRIEDGWHQTSVVKVFLSVLQYAVTDLIANWNCHKVRAINERGRHRPAHIPEIAFQTIDRVEGRVLPPLYQEGAVQHRIQITVVFEDHQDADHWNRFNLGGQFEAGMQDLEDEGLRYLWDLAYFLHHSKLELITCKFKLHVALTLECRLSIESGLSKAIYLQNKLAISQPFPGTFLALQLLFDTFQDQVQQSDRQTFQAGDLLISRKTFSGG